MERAKKPSKEDIHGIDPFEDLKLETVMIDVPNHIFRINGIDCGHGAERISIDFTGDGSEVCVKVKKDISFYNFDRNGNLTGHKRINGQ